MTAVLDDTLPTAEERRWIEAARADARQRVFESAVPAEYRQARLRDLEDRSWHELLGWLAGDGPTLVLTGPSGSGKTHAAYALLHDAAASGIRTYAATLDDLHSATQPGTAPSPTERLAIEADLFLFDDVDRDRATPTMLEQLDEILADRLAEGKRQIITTTSGATTVTLRGAWA